MGRAQSIMECIDDERREYMNIIKYIAFLKTVETGSITLASQSLGYTQSAISKMIADLENEWNVKLLTRSRTGIEVSSEGLLLLPMVKEIVRQYNELNFTVSEIHGLKSGLLRLGCFTSFSTSVLPLVIRDFNEKYPSISIQLKIGEYLEISRWIQDGSVDCGILSMEMKDSVDMSFLMRDRLVAILPEGHPQADADVFRISQIPENNFIILKETEDFEMSGFLHRHNIAPARSYEVNSDFALLSMVETGTGISVVHESILSPKRFNVIKKPLDKTEYFDVGIGLRQGSTPSTACKLFVNSIRDYLKQK